MTTSTVFLAFIAATFLTVVVASLQDVICPSCFGTATGKNMAASASSAHNGTMMENTESCEDVLRLLAYDEEIAAGEQINDVTGQNTFHYPIYDADTKLELGSYTGFSTTIGEDDCIGSGIFNLDWNEEEETFDSQIFVSVSCSGSFNGIVGGTGNYAFIKNGHEKFVGHAAGSISELHFTSPECQPPTSMHFSNQHDSYSSQNNLSALFRR